MILNKDQFPKFTSSNSVELNTHSYVFSSIDWSDNDYWFFEFHSSFAFSVLINYIPQTILEKIRNDNTTFLIAANSYESFHDIVEPFYNFLISNSIPLEKAILISESATIDEQVKYVAKKLDTTLIQTWWFLGWEWIVKLQTEKHPRLLTLEKTQYNKKFLCLNRRWRLHRPILVALLALDNLLDKGHVSLGKSDDDTNWKIVLKDMKRIHANTCLSNYIDRFEKEIGNLPYMYLDTSDLITNQAEVIRDTDTFYLSSYFSIVTETYYYETDNSGIFFSEKTFKPIAKLHPFILVGKSGSLEKLRKIGYQTFHPFINESYDLEKDDSKRMLMIATEINRLANLSDSELKIFLNNVNSIVKYNYFRFKSVQKRIIKLL